ncbi:proline racemase family protein [Tahibacter amnicola]|uniref:Proline racemase family protein n=1 Tax=Tahibacter amnicola TaxID=2976241 RepID=A0ABY6BDP9_9GAMM|nr:proline racemase family protein [Tahibacter amnicola]UXI67235.1 proline racemase family protein [Tahibacter amnicola]
MSRTRIIDSHTGGEPTRVVVEGGPPLKGLNPQAAREQLQREHDAWRRAIACEPRGSDVMVGAYLLEPTQPGCIAGVVFFNNVGYLGMCGHGTIGVAETLRHLGRIGPGRFKLETPVGVVEVELHDDGRVSIANVPSYRIAARVPVEVDGYGRLHGDIAWGGNWFFLVDDHGLEIDRANIGKLMDCAVQIRRALEKSAITGTDGAEIDHVELVGPSPTGGVNARNFVLCPGLAYDRSPCGTGTSAKLACLAADGKLQPGDTWRQESVIGSEFEGRYARTANGAIQPVITGRAHVVAESVLVFDPADTLTWGFA